MHFLLAVRDQLKSGRVIIAHAKYIDKESVEICSPEVNLYISVYLLIVISCSFSVNS